MFQSLSEIAQTYDISAKAVGEALYILGIRDSEHPIQKGFPYEQSITHGIAKPIEDKKGEVHYFHYDIGPIKEEFEKVVASRKKARTQQQERRESGQILQEGLIQIEDLLPFLSDSKEQARLIQIKAEVAALQSHLLNTNIDLALPLDEKAKALLERLRIWRREEARKEERPAFSILGNTVLHYLAYYQPHKEEELLDIKGFGEKKMKAYGQSLLREIVRTYGPTAVLIRTRSRSLLS